MTSTISDIVNNTKCQLIKNGAETSFQLIESQKELATISIIN